jgi:hypothetical protein
MEIPVDVNIPPRGGRENGAGGSPAAGPLSIAVVLCFTFAGCRLELAVDPGNLAPSINEVRMLLEQDRVRLALDRAVVLDDLYRGPQADLVLGWALWRNGHLRDAEARFRRAAGAGLDEGKVGMAAVRASAGDWQAARELATSGLAAAEPEGPAHALLASAAWRRGDRVTAVSELRAWSRVATGTARARAAEAMATALERLQGPIHEWSGEAADLLLVELDDGTLAVEAKVGGVTALLAVDLTFRQSLISERLAASAGLAVAGATSPGTRGPSARWPAILAPRQAPCPRLELGGLALSNVVLAVGEAPAGVDGVLAIDVLGGVRWSLDTGARSIALARRDALERNSAHPMAWLQTRLVHEGLAVQMLLFPRVEDRVVAAGLDLAGGSRLDSDLLPVSAGSGAAPTRVQLGGWRGEVLWRPASLSGWAIDGGVAPTAVLGSNLLGGWRLSWYPETGQIRIDEPTRSAARPLQ